MALSMDEQRMLAEIERRLAAEDPGLAVRLSSFRRPGPAARFRTTRGRIIGSLFAIGLVAVVSLMVYAMIPFRAHTYRPANVTQASSRPAATAQLTNRPAKTPTTPKTSANPSASNKSG
jgi:Protein of unknown function (DUF3040)